MGSLLDPLTISIIFEKSINLSIVMDLSETFPLLNDVQDILNTEARLNEIIHTFRVPRTIFRDQLNPLEKYSRQKFYDNMGFTKDGFLFVLDIFKDKLDKGYNPGSPTISPLNRLAIYVHYLRSSGNFYRSESEISWIELPVNTICNVLNQTAIDIASFSSKYIAFPDEEKREVIANYFLENFDFPGCVGIFGEF